MESADEISLLLSSHAATSVSISAAADPSLPLTVTLGLGLLFLFSTPNSKSLKPISTAIKIADDAFKTSAAPHRALLIASKAIIKAHGRLRPNPQQQSAKQIKTLFAAANFARSSAKILHAHHHPLFALGFLAHGYKLSKNLIRILEGFVGLQVGPALQHWLKTAGTLVRAAAVAAEIQRRISPYVASRYGKVRLIRSYKRLEFDGCYCSQPSSLRFLPVDCQVECITNGDLLVAGWLIDDQIFELLSLAVPLNFVL